MADSDVQQELEGVAEAAGRGSERCCQDEEGWAYPRLYP